MVSPPFPMWKWIGSPAAWAISQSGSQCGFADDRQAEALRLAR